MGIDGTPSGVAYHGLWNVSVWSLLYEAAVYVVFGGLVGMAWFRARSAVSVCALLLVGVAVQFGAGAGPDSLREPTRLVSFFAASVLLWFLRQHLPNSRSAAVRACAM